MTSCVWPPLIAGRHPTKQADTSTVGPRHPPVERLGGQRSPRTTPGREQQSSPFDAAAAGESLAPSTAEPNIVRGARRQPLPAGGRLPGS